MEEVKSGHLPLAKIITKTILSKLDSENIELVVAKVEFEDDKESYELSCHSNNFILTLEKNLQILINAEAYEECPEVVKAIKYLKNNKSYDIQI